MIKTIVFVLTIIATFIFSSCSANNKNPNDDYLTINREGNNIEIYEKTINGTKCIIAVYPSFGISNSCDWP